MRIVITGSSGNLGSSLLRRLTASGEHDLVGLVRRPPQQAGPPYDAVDWRRVDLTDDASSPTLLEAFAGADAVVHLAWGFQPSHRLDVLEELGVGGTGRVLAAAGSVGVPHLLHTSSVGAYSPKSSDDPVDESYPTGGIAGSPYSRHKAAAERLLDRFERQHPGTTVTRMRPGIVGQRRAGSAFLRYGVPGYVPARLIRAVPALPLDSRLLVPIVHADDVADAYVRAIEGSVPGPFNLAADEPITVADIGAALGARPVPVPAVAVRTAVSVGWHARLLQLDPGWIDLAYGVPVQDSSRARSELGWVPRHSGPSVLTELVEGLTSAASDATPVLRPRGGRDELGKWLSQGSVSRRRLP